jgi:hypothetical protein
MMASIAMAPSFDRLGSARNNAVTEESVSAFCRASLMMKSSARSPDQEQRDDKVSTSGFRPCDIRVRVEAGTVACSATFFHVRPRALLVESSAEKNRSPSNFGGDGVLLSCNLVPFEQYGVGIAIRQSGTASAIDAVNQGDSLCQREKVAGLTAVRFQVAMSLPLTVSAALTPRSKKHLVAVEA